MEHREDKSQDAIFYVVALICGLFTGAIINQGFVWIPVGGIFGLLTAATFLKFIVRGRNEA